MWKEKRKMPKVSIVLTTHPTRDEVCKKAVESVFAQTYHDWELIIVHDGINPTLDISWYKKQDKNPITLYDIEHFGNDTKPKNFGILQAKGSYIAFLDSDNTFRPDHLQLLVNELDRDPELSVAYGDRWLNDETGQVPAQIGKYSDYTPGKLMVENYIDTSDVLIRREALMYVGGFDESQKKYIDWNLWARLEKAGVKFKRVPFVITDYNIGKDSKSVTKLTENEKKFMANNPGKFQNIPDFDTVDCEIRLPYLGEVQEPRVAIFTLTYDRLELTKKSFESLSKTAGYPYHHYIVDNGSTDGTKEWLADYKEHAGFTFVIDREKNEGISRGSNTALLGIGKGNYDIIVKVDNDAIFQTEGWLKKMVEIWKTNHQIIMSCYVEGLKDNPGGAPRYHRGRIKGELVGMTNHLGGVCVFADASAYDNFRWDEDDYLHSAQDLAFSQYVTTHGFAMAYLENYSLRHATAEMMEQYPDYYERRVNEKRTRYATDGK